VPSGANPSAPANPSPPTSSNNKSGGSGAALSAVALVALPAAGYFAYQQYVEAATTSGSESGGGGDDDDDGVLRHTDADDFVVAPHDADADASHQRAPEDKPQRAQHEGSAAAAVVGKEEHRDEYSAALDEFPGIVMLDALGNQLPTGSSSSSSAQAATDSQTTAAAASDRQQQRPVQIDAAPIDELLKEVYGGGAGLLGSAPAGSAPSSSNLGSAATTTTSTSSTTSSSAVDDDAQRSAASRIAAAMDGAAAAAAAAVESDGGANSKSSSSKVEQGGGAALRAPATAEDLVRGCKVFMGVRMSGSWATCGPLGSGFAVVSGAFRSPSINTNQPPATTRLNPHTHSLKRRTWPHLEPGPLPACPADSRSNGGLRSQGRLGGGCGPAAAGHC